MSLPFALASYAYMFMSNRTLPDWKRAIVLWVGMPLALLAAELIMLAETGITYAAGFRIDNVPTIYLRLVIGEGAACLVWAGCLLLFLRGRGRTFGLSSKSLGMFFVSLYSGVLLAHGCWFLVRRYFSHDIYGLLESGVTTIISAMIIIYNRVSGRAGHSIEDSPSPNTGSQPSLN